MKTFIFALLLSCNLFADSMTCCHGGVPLVPGLTAHILWYGDWSAQTLSKTLVPQFVADASATPQIGVVRSYYSSGAAVTKVSQSIALGSQAFVAYSATYGPPGVLTTVPPLVSAVIGSGGLPAPTTVGGNPASIYIVMLAPGIVYSVGGACGFHNADGSIGGVAGTPYILVNDMTTIDCASATTGTNTVTGSALVTQQTDVLEHEFAEAIGFGWLNGASQEIADVCQSSFTVLGTAPNGQSYTALVNSHYYYLQDIWRQIPQSGNIGKCAGAAVFPSLLMIGKATQQAADDALENLGSAAVPVRKLHR